MKDKEFNLEEVKVRHTLVGVSYVLILHINSVKEVETHLEVVSANRNNGGDWSPEEPVADWRKPPT